MNYNHTWQHQHYTVLRHKKLEEEIYHQGFAVAAQLPAPIIQELKELYTSTHHFTQAEGGMFYSVYSQDIAYRKKIHHAINTILQPVYQNIFQDYRCMLNSFIVKVSGPKSEFYMHQDSTGLDETKYSPLSVWIPLQDTTVENGCMCVVPQSHGLFSPYRGITIPAPFEPAQECIQNYLVPVELKAGEVLLFDNRIVHNSGANNSGHDRVVVMSGIFPKQAVLWNCYKDPSQPNTIEIMEQADEFLIDYPKFLHGCYDKPAVGITLKHIADEWPAITAAELEALFEEKKIAKNTLQKKGTEVNCNLLDTPV